MFPKGSNTTTSNQNTNYTNGTESGACRRLFENGKEVKKSFAGNETRNANWCRHCGDRWFSGHKCKNQRFKSMEVEGECEEEEG